jgi:hypothetical protein
MILKMKFNFNFKITLPLLASLLGAAAPLAAQENYVVTYTHQMEEPGNLEIGLKSIAGAPQGGSGFTAVALELEYGAKGWWTTELYLDGQSTRAESTVFTGFRWENRVRPLLREHWINPVLYAEFEDINSADKTLLEVVGHDTRDDFLGRNDRSERKREMEMKLILSSNVRGWNFSENLIAEKNLAGEPWEFGYALGVSRPLSLRASAKACTFCRENLALGAEAYGGLGDRYRLGLQETSHYVAPVLTLRTPTGYSFHLSPTFGLNDNSHAFLMRFGVAYEIDQIFSKLRRH